MAFRASDFGFNDKVGPPRSVSAYRSYKVDAKPSGLHRNKDDLWIVEYAEPVLLDPSGRTAAQQGTREYGTSPASDKATAGNANKARPPTSKQPATETEDEPPEQARRAKMSKQRVEVDESGQAVTNLKVNPSHCSATAQQCGWAIRIALNPSTGLPASSATNSADGPGVLVSDEHIFVGEGVRGFGIAKQLTFDYAIVMRCSFTSGYSCRVEFHSLQPELDPGVPADDTTQASGGSTASPAATGSSPGDQDAAARKGDSRNSRAKRTTSSATRSKATAGSVAAQKKASGPKPDTTPEQRNLGASGSLRSAIKIPVGCVGFDYHVDSTSNFMMFLPASGAQPYVPHVTSNGQDFDDSVHRMNLPAIASLPLQVLTNEVFVFYKGEFKITPRCMLSVGDECKDDPHAKSASKEEPGGNAKPTPKPRGLNGAKSSSAALTAEVVSGGRQLAEQPDIDRSKCLSAQFPLVPATPTLLYFWQTTFLVGPVPVTIRVEIALVYYVDFVISLCIQDKAVIGGLVPGVALQVIVFGGILIP